MCTLAVAGSRTIKNTDYVCCILDREHRQQPITSILTTEKARGVGSMATQWAKRKGTPAKHIRAVWSHTDARHLRDHLLIRSADAVLVFWDGYSKGMSDIILEARRQSKQLKIIYTDNECF